MKLPVKNDLVDCPRDKEKREIQVCKHCAFLGWVTGAQVVCRWSLLKEQLLRKERIYMDIVD